MTWWMYAIIAMLAGTAFNLCLKWARNLKIAAERFFFYVFAGQAIGFFLIGYFSSNLPSLFNPASSDRVWLMISWGIGVATFSVLANYFLAIAYNNAPNPGYVEGIKSSNAILTTLLGYLFFAAAISRQKWLGIGIIPFGLLFFKSKKKEKDGKTEKEETDKAWILPAFFYAFFLSGMFTIYKYMTKYLGFTVPEVLLSLTFFAAIGFLVIGLFEKEPWKYSFKMWLPILIGIVVAILSNGGILLSVTMLKNPGPPQAILNSQAIVTLLAAMLLFRAKDGGEFSWKKLLGIVVVLTGVIIIILSK